MEQAVAEAWMTNEERWSAVTGELFVRWAAPAAPVASVVLLHGYSEHSERYGRAIRALVDAGFAVAAPDQSGHGRTGPRLGAIPPGTQLIGDALVVRRRAAQRVPGRPVFAIGSSMGGLVTLGALLREPAAFSGAVLQAPAIAMPANVSRPMLMLAQGLGVVAPRLPIRPFFNATRATRDEDFQAWMRSDPHTYKGWVQAGTAMRSIALVRRVRSEVHGVRCPILITHGTDDRRVHPRETAWLQEELAGPVERRLFQGLRHEAHQEPEGMEVIQAWVDWLHGQVAQQAAS
jgi:alpha-beta hydrolase superfamily lysophospholipase